MFSSQILQNAEMNIVEENMDLSRIYLAMYSRVHISSDTAFLKIVKKPSIVQE